MSDRAADIAPDTGEDTATPNEAVDDAVDDAVDTAVDDAVDDAVDTAAADTGDTASADTGDSGGLDHVAGLVLAGLAAVGLAVSISAGSVATLVAVAVVQALLIASWVIGTGLPGRVGAIVTGVLAAGASDAVVTHWPHGALGTLIAVLGLAIPAMFLHQLIRGASRVRVVESLSDIALLLVAITALAALIQLRHEVDGKAMGTAVALVAGAALVAGHLVDTFWSRPRFDPAVARGLTAVLASTVAGALVAVARLHGSVEFNTERSLLLGGALALVTALFAVGASFIEQTSTLPVQGVARRLRPLFGALLGLALMSPVAYLLCLAIRG